MPDINPFAEDIVKEPRQIETGVPGLNDDPLGALLQEFAHLEGGELPRPPRQRPHARLVASPAPGYGKSHLVGRLFLALAGRATLVNVRPFRVPEGDWKALLGHTVDELGMPDRFTGDGPEPHPSQSVVFAHGVLSHLARAVMLDKFPHTATHKALQAIAQTPLETHRLARRYPSWPHAIEKLMTVHQNALVLELARHCPRLHARPESWLNLLHTLAFGQREPPLLRSALDWLKGETIDEEEAKILGLRGNDRSQREGTPTERNARAKERLLDLCRLAGFFRPFLFCFDQTETYGDSRKLARAFGQLVQEMQQELPNQLTVVTTNLEPWEKRIRKRWEEAALARIAPPLEMAGITAHQGAILIMNRLADYQQAGEAARFPGPGWLEAQFAQRPAMGTRTFLQLCRSRWEEVENQGVAPPPPTLAQLFAGKRELALRTPSRLGFDPQLLFWAASTALSAAPGTLKKKGKSLEMSWRPEGAPQPTLMVRLDGSNHWKHWLSLAQQAVRVHGNQGTRCLYPRTPELVPIPAPTWQAAGPFIRQALADGALIIPVLPPDELATLLAAWELHADGAAGDIPFPPGEVETFLREALQPFRERLLAPLAQPPAATPPPAGPDHDLAKKLRAIMHRTKLLTEAEVLAELGEAVEPGRLHAAREQVPEIRLHEAGGHVAWQWVTPRP